MTATAPSARRDAHEPLPPEVVAPWLQLGVRGGADLYPSLVGFDVEEVRRDYARLRLPFRRQLLQAGGVVHGGVAASLIDSAVVPAIGAAYEPGARFSTLDLHVQYLGAVVDEDLVAEGWIVRRGRSIVFCEAEVVTDPGGRLIARGQMTYKVG